MMGLMMFSINVEAKIIIIPVQEKVFLNKK